MATNPFDQFDEPATPSKVNSSANPFDQFDEPSETNLDRAKKLAREELDIGYEMSKDSPYDFSGERTLGGTATEIAKAFPREAAAGALQSIEGLKEYSQYLPAAQVATAAVEKGLGFLGFEPGKEGKDSPFRKARDYLREDSFLRGDDKYQDVWTVKLGGGAGSTMPFLLSRYFLGPIGLRATAFGSGAGEQADRIKQAREAGVDVSELEEFGGLTLGGAIGLSETYLPERLVKTLKSVPKSIPIGEKNRILSMVKRGLSATPEIIKTGGKEGAQEVFSSISQTLVEMGYNPDAELPSGQSLWDDFSVGFVVGAGADAIANGVSARRVNAVSDIDLEREREARQAEEANNFMLGQQLRDEAEQRAMMEADPLAFERQALAARQGASQVAMPSLEEVSRYVAPSVTSKDPTPASTGELYAMRIIGSLRNYFPSQATFTVEQDGDGFRVVDESGVQYGQRMGDKRVASSVASNLNKEISNKGIRGSILDTLMTSPDSYSPQDADALFRYGFRTLSPEANRVSFGALNEAAGTTTEKGYVEDLPLDLLAGAKKLRDGRYSIQMPDGSTQYIAGLTASQKLNLERTQKGLPPATTFDIKEARQFLNGNLGALAQPAISGIQDNAEYGGTLDEDGKPVVMSSAGEVLTGRIVTEAEKLRAGQDEDGNDILPDYIEFKTLDEAKRYAGRLNQRGQGSRFLPAEVLRGKKDLKPDIKRLLEAKNIISEPDSEELGQLVKSFTGADSFADMSLDDQKLFYARVRELPALSKPSKIPVFKTRSMTTEQLGRREIEQKQEKRLREEERQAVEAFPVEFELTKDLARLGIPLEMFKVKTRITDREGNDITDQTEGYFDPALNELVVAIDSIDPEGKLTEEERVYKLRDVLTHETIHAIRSMDLFTQKEWALLESAVARTKRQPPADEKDKRDETYLQRARRMYPDESPLVQVEEAIAELARDYIGNRRLIGGKPKNMLERIIRFFTKLRNFVEGKGFNSFRDVLRAVEAGRVGRRKPGEVRSLRTTEARQFDLYGAVPARYAPFIDEFEGAPVVAPPSPLPTFVQPQATQGAGPTTDFDLAALEGADVRYSRKDVQSSKDWAYSPLMKAVESVSPKVTTAKQWEQWLDANASKLGVSKDEIEFSGIKDFIALKEGKVSKDDVLAYLDQNGVQVTETQLGASADNESAIADELELYFNDESSGYENIEFIRNSDGTITVMSDGDFVVANGMPSAIAEEYGIELDDIEGADEATKYENYTLPGGKDYRELLLTLPKIHTSDPRILRMDELKSLPHTEENIAEYSRLAQETKGGRAGMEFRSSHWKEPNIVAHTRIDTRTDANGEPVLFVNEIQSDWGQEGRKKGFSRTELYNKYDVLVDGEPVVTFDNKEDAEKAAEDAKTYNADVKIQEVSDKKEVVGVPKGPFVAETKSWVALTIKRLLRYAVDNGFKKVAFINGQQAADIYDLSKQISGLRLVNMAEKYPRTHKNAKPYKLIAYRGQDVVSENDVNENEIEDFVGKEVAKRLIESEPVNQYERTISGLELNVGGEGMKSFYDRIVPQVATDVIRKIGGKGLSDVYVPTRNSYQGKQRLITVVPVEGSADKYQISGDSKLYDTYEEADMARYDIYKAESRGQTKQVAIEITPEMERNILAGQRLFSRKDMPDTIEVDGVQRPTVNSKGQQIHNTEDGVRNFWRWFGDSKVVDSEGKPRVLYHSTTGDFSEFEYGRRASGNMLGKGFYFGGYELAEGYSDTNVPGTNIIPAYLSIKNPFYGELTEDDVAKIKSAMPEFVPVYDKILLETSGKIPSIERVATATKNRNEFIQNALVAAGYDGRIQSYSPDSPWEDWESEYVAFNPSQIKSAIANTGAFSPESSDIRYSRKATQSPIEDAIKLAQDKHADLKIDGEEEFFKHWSKLLRKVGNQLNPTPYGLRVAAQRAVNDMQEWIKNNSRYADYYDKDMVAVRDALKEKYGKVSDDDMRAFQLFAGLTSPNTGLKSNIGDALALLDLLKTDGSLDQIKLGLSDNNNVVIERSPFQISGNTNGNKARSAKVFDRLIREKGSVSKAVDFLMEPVTDKELKAFNKEMGYKSDPEMGKVKRLVKSATGQEEKIPRMFIFGPKVGAYTMNLTGDRKYTTIDIWESRFIRSYFNNLFKEETGLPVDDFEHDLFTRFGDYFKEEFDKLTGKDWDPASLQAMRWFYIINATNKAGYTGASTNDTISEYTRQQLYTAGKSGEYRRGQGNEKARSGTRKYSRQDQPAEGQPSAAAGESGLRERGGVRGGEGLLRDAYRPYQEAGRAGKSLAGLLKRVKVDGRIVEFESFAPAQRLAEEYMKEAGMPYNPPTTYVRVDPTRSTKIADEFGRMKHNPQDPLVQAAYRQMMKETSDQYRKILESGLKVEFIKGDDPYGNPRNAILDVIENNHFWVFPTVDGFGSSELDVSNNPLLEETEFKDANGETMLANDVFRVVHDYFGHIMHGVGFRADGEENAWRAHASMYSPLARRAMTTETRGQNSYVNYGPNGEFNRSASPSETIYADQKVGLLPEWVSTDTYEGVLEEAVQKAQKDIDDTGKFAVPLYSLEASPEALYVAQNPEQGKTLSDGEKRRYSRQNTPQFGQKAKDIMDRVTPEMPDETLGETILKKMDLPPVRDMFDIFRKNFVNRYARLERQYRENPELKALLADVSSMAMTEMADHARQFTQRALVYGVPVYEKGMVKVKEFVHKGKKYRGLIEVMAMLHTKEHGNLEQLAHAYATAVRGERLNKEGKLSPVKPGELKILEEEVNKFVNPATGQPIIKEWFETWQAYNSNIVKFLKDTGVIDDAGAELWMKQSDYIPFYRENAEGNLEFPRVFGGLHTAGQFKAVGKSDKALNVDMITAITGNIDAAIAMGMKNVAQQRIIRDQMKLGLASLLKPGEAVGNRNSVSFKVGGKRYTAIIDDPLIYESMLPVSEIQLDGLFGNFLRIPASWLRELIIREPGYMVANMFRDTLSSYVITGAQITPLVDTAKNMFADLTDLENLGLVGGYDLRIDRDSVKKFYEKNSKLMGMKGGINWTNPIMAAWDGLGRLSTRSEAATRLAVYNDVLARTGNEAEAQYQALSVMNYGRRGGNPLFRALTAIVPFMNARVQGLDKLWQATFGRIGAKYETDAQGNVTRNLSNFKNFQRYFIRAGYIVGMSALYYALMHDDDEYKNATPEVRDNYYIIPIQKGNVAAGEPGLAVRLPIPFEVGVLFKVMPERFLAATFGEDTPRDMQESFWRNLKSTLAMNPIPQTFLPFVEVGFNKDTYTGRPIVPTYMENLLPEQQTTFYTNKFVEDIANVMGVSPMKLDHLAQGYGGSLGAYLLQAVDSAWRSGGEKKPALAWYQYPVVKRFFATANQPGLQSQFYDLKDYMDGITKTINDLEERGQYDELATFYAKNGHIYEMRSTVNYMNRYIARLRDQRKMVEQMDIDPESKREMIEQINMQIAASLTTVPMLRQQAFGPREEE